MPTKFKRWMCLLVMMGFASQSTANAQMPSAGSPGEVTAVPQAAVIPKAKKFAATGQGVGISQTNAACLTPADLSSSCAVGPCFCVSGTIPISGNIVGSCSGTLEIQYDTGTWLLNGTGGLAFAASGFLTLALNNGSQVNLLVSGTYEDTTGSSLSGRTTFTGTYVGNGGTEKFGDTIGSGTVSISVDTTGATGSLITLDGVLGH